MVGKYSDADVAVTTAKSRVDELRERASELKRQKKSPETRRPSYEINEELKSVNEELGRAREKLQARRRDAERIARASKDAGNKGRGNGSDNRQPAGEGDLAQPGGGISSFAPGMSDMDKLRARMIMAHMGYNDARLSGHGERSIQWQRDAFHKARDEYAEAGGKDIITDEKDKRSLLVLGERRVQMELDGLAATERLGYELDKRDISRREWLNKKLSEASADLERYDDLKAGKIYKGHKGPGIGNLKTDKPDLRDGDSDTVVGERRPRKSDEYKTAPPRDAMNMARKATKARASSKSNGAPKRRRTNKQPLRSPGGTPRITINQK